MTSLNRPSHHSLPVGVHGRPLSSAFAESWPIYSELANFSIWISGTRCSELRLIRVNGRYCSPWKVRIGTYGTKEKKGEPGNWPQEARGSLERSVLELRPRGLGQRLGDQHPWPARLRLLRYQASCSHNSWEDGSTWVEEEPPEITRG